MKASWAIALCAILTFTVTATSVWGQTSDPLNGTWKLNLSRSKFVSGPSVKSQTRAFEVNGDTVKQTLDGMDANGEPTHMTFTAHYDGKEYPVSGNPDADTISVKRTDSHSAKSILKKDGKVTMTTMRHVSSDGKTLTLESKGTSAKGEKINNTLVFDKQ